MRRSVAAAAPVVILAACSPTSLAPVMSRSPAFARPGFRVPALASGYAAIDLGTLGGAYSEALAVNGGGTIMGVSTTPGTTDLTAFLWADGVLTDLGALGDCVGTRHALNEVGQVVCGRYLWANGVRTDLGGLGGAFTRAAAINDLGQVAGQSETAGGEFHAFLWADGAMTDLGTLGATYSRAVDVNGGGQVVGYSTTAAGFSAVHAFSWRDGVMTDLGTLGGASSYAVAVNDAGQVAGGAETADGSSHAFLWQAGVMTDLGTLGGARSVALALSEQGQVVGGSTTAAGETHAFLWDHGAMTDLGTPGGPYSEAIALNEAGQVVGIGCAPEPDDPRAECGSSFSVYHAFLWADGALTDLGTLGGTFGQAVAINGAGQIVGRATTTGQSGHIEDTDGHAVLWRPMTPAEWVRALAGEVNGLAAAGTLTRAQADRLLARLRQCLASLDAARTGAAVYQLEAFIDLVQELVRRGVLVPSPAQPLVAAARGIIARLQAATG